MRRERVAARHDAQLRDRIAVVVEHVGQRGNPAQPRGDLRGDHAQPRDAGAEHVHDEGLGQTGKALAGALDGRRVDRQLHAGQLRFVLDATPDRVERVDADAVPERDLDLAGVRRLGVRRRRRRADARVDVRHRGVAQQALRNPLDRGAGVEQRRARWQRERLEQGPFVGQRQEVDRHQRQAGQAEQQHRESQCEAGARGARDPVEQPLVGPLQRAQRALAGAGAGARADEAQAERNQRQRNQQRRQQRDDHRQREGDEEQPDQSADEQQRNVDRDIGQRAGEVGHDDRAQPGADSRPVRVAALPAVMDALEHDDRVVGKQADGDGQCAEGHQVQALAEGVQRRDRDRQRQRDAQRQHDDAAPGAQHPEQQQHREQGAEQQVATEVGADDADQVALVVAAHPVHAVRQRRARALQHGLHRGGDGRGRCPRLLDHGQRDAGPAVEADRVVRRHRRAFDARQRAQRDRAVRGRHRDRVELGDVPRQLADFDRHVVVTQSQIAGWREQHLRPYRALDRVDADVVAPHRVEIGLDPQRFVAGAVDVDELHAGDRAQRRRDVGAHHALHPRRRDAGRNAQRVVGDLVDRVAHDAGGRVRLRRQLRAGAIDGAVDRLQVGLGLAVPAEAHVDLHRAVAHRRAHAVQSAQCQDAAFQRIDEQALELGRGRPRQMRGDADLREVERRQHLDRRVHEGVDRPCQHRAQHQQPQHAAAQQP
ncbi:hypothetical protein GALL_435810 [mine drainage metagenome]|uniref:Uncharacterized protein n=1 Tax=mine drainage metagenome TaxID=410659 RepID=A0A1J5PV63_9ZZZZ